MTIEWGSQELSDEAFVRSFEACKYPNERFRHANHLRLAWIYVRRDGRDAAEARVTAAIHRFAASLNHAEKYHDTITRTWLRLVAFAQSLSPGRNEFGSFIDAHRWLLDLELLMLFYSPERLMSNAARRSWRPPDRRALPT